MEMAVPTLSIILVNYNGLAFNKACIDSLLAQTYQDFDIIFVDNASTDGSLEEVRTHYAHYIDTHKISIVQCHTNTGFTGGNNIGHKATHDKTPYILLLNNDTVAQSNMLETLVQTITQTHIGGVTCSINEIGFEEKQQNTYNSHKTIITNYFGDCVLKKVPDEEFLEGIFTVSCLSGCCFMYKKSLVTLPFLEYYFAYGEDVQLSYNILLQGYALKINTNTSIIHYGSAFFGKQATVFKVFHGTKNQRMNFLTFYPTSITLILLPLFLLVQSAQIFLSNPRIRIQGKYKALIRLFHNREKIIQERKKNQVLTQKNNTNFSAMQQLSYKFSDDIYFAKFSPFMLKIISCINKLFRVYYTIFRIPYSN